MNLYPGLRLPCLPAGTLSLLLAFLTVSCWTTDTTVAAFSTASHTRQRLSVSSSTCIRSSTSSSTTTPDNIKEVWGIVPDISKFPGANFPLGGASPILELPNFLTAEQCELIRSYALFAMEHGAPECDEYLNARVNQEVDQQGHSEEGRALLEEFDLDKSGDLTAGDRGGFRIRLDQEVIHRLIKERLLDVLGMKDRTLVFEEGAWIRPTPRTVVVRDQTVVLYSPGHGVPPHVDGKDGTLLLYLSNGEDLLR